MRFTVNNTDPRSPYSPRTAAGAVRAGRHRITMSGRLSAATPLAVLVLLAAGRTVAQTANVTTWSRRRVVELARHLGWHYDIDADVVYPVHAAVAS